MDEKRCCLAIVESQEQVKAALQILKGSRKQHLSLSFFHKPEPKYVADNCNQFMQAGTLLGDGPLAGTLVSPHGGPDCQSSALAHLLNDIGVPESHHHIYETVVDQGLTLIVLQGPENDLRIGCEALTPLCLEKPVLFFC